MIAARVNGQGSTFQVESIQPLFSSRATASDYPYDVTPDGQRFLMITLPQSTDASEIAVIVNWTPPVRRP